MRRPPSRRLVGLVAAVVAAAGLVGCGPRAADPTPATTRGVGSVVVPVAPLATVGATSSTIQVQLPTGRLTVSSTAPMTVVPARAAADGHAHKAGAGRSYIGVDWGFAIGDGVPVWAGPLVDGAAVQVALGLRTSGDDYQLGVASSGPGTSGSARTSGGYLLVDGDGSAASLDVAFDGVTQVVDLRTGARAGGPDTGLGALPTGQPTGQSCDSTVLPDGVDAAGAGRGITCSWWHRTLPWVSGLGWADPSGKTSGGGWVVAEVTTAGMSWTRGAGTWRVDAISDEQQGAARTVPVSSQATSLSSIYVLATGTSSLPVSRTVVGTLQAGSGPADAALAIAGDLPVS